ncbi:hypothetical protein [Cupriavidus sp. SW-Y-13]|uniref:hypothetical protein n=1 Tax=Cupriavidus sp. SW-Y-13 TaxID=2653854 RepID=UPI0013656954|nr:hypothetical protein [Cupriavidus sp. SW-Y-13]MWL90516.1 hypothetical protein [Cupriavidus sp. SW-Y-13]
MPQSHSILSRSDAGSASASAVAASGVPAPLPFRQDDDVVSGPAGVSILLLLIAVVAVLWFAARGRTQQPWLARVLKRGMQADTRDAAIEVSAQAQLHGGVRLHVIRWEGGRVLAAVNAAGQVTVLQAAAGERAPGGDEQ